jgi:hypothetical protein
MIEFLAEVMKWIRSHLSDIGTFLMGIAAIQGVNSFNRSRQEQKSAAAIKLQSLVKSFTEDCTELVLKPGLFEYEGYDFEFIPSQKSKNPTTFPERPARILTNRHKKFKKEVIYLLPGIGGDAASQVSKKLNQLDKMYNNIQGYLQSLNHADRKAPLQYKQSDEYKKDLENTSQEIKEILTPIINGHNLNNIFNKLKSIFSQYFTQNSS